jgi:hypothetical protein
METALFWRLANVSKALLPIREAYEWKHDISHEIKKQLLDLLPIREAYEWKRNTAMSHALFLRLSSILASNS